MKIEQNFNQYRKKLFENKTSTGRETLIIFFGILPIEAIKQPTDLACLYIMYDDHLYENVYYSKRESTMDE